MDKFTELINDVGKLWSKYSEMYMLGAWKTVKLAFVATFFGCIIGLFCGILQTIPINKRDNPVKKALLYLVRGVIRAYVELFRGTPMILQSIFIFYGIPFFFTSLQGKFDPVTAAYIVVSINTGAYMAETVRGGIFSIGTGQTEGAMAIGMNHFQTMTSVILPQTIRNIIPQIGNNLIINIKDTSVMFVIGYSELFTTHKNIVGISYKTFPSAVIVMIMYLVMTVVCSVLLRLWEKKMDGPENFDVATTDTLAHTSGMTTFVKSSKRFKR